MRSTEKTSDHFKQGLAPKIFCYNTLYIGWTIGLYKGDTLNIHDIPGEMIIKLWKLQNFGWKGKDFKLMVWHPIPTMPIHKMLQNNKN